MPSVAVTPVDAMPITRSGPRHAKLSYTFPTSRTSNDSSAFKSPCTCVRVCVLVYVC